MLLSCTLLGLLIRKISQVETPINKVTAACLIVSLESSYISTRSEMGMDDELRKARALAKRTFTRKCTLLRSALSNEEGETVVEDLWNEVSEAYNKVEKCHEEYLAFLTHTEADEALVDEVEAYIIELEKRKYELLSSYRKSKRQPNKDASKEKDVRVKVKALQPPCFSGEIREYHNFKEDYKRLMECTFSKDPYALRSCLSGEALMAVRGVENDYDEMFKRLDEKFGDNRKLVDAVISDLKSLKPIKDGDNKGFVKMVEKIERCWLDMRRSS